MRHHDRSTGFTVIELVTALGIVAIVAALGTSIYIGNIRTAESLDALETITALKERVAIAHSTASENLLVCDDSMVKPGDLDNPYLALGILPIALDENDLSKGYGAAAVISADLGSHGSEGVAVAKTLYEELTGQNADARNPVISDTVTSFTVVLSDPGRPVCKPDATAPRVASNGVQALSPPAAFSPDETRQANELVQAGVNDPVFAAAMANALAKARLSGGQLSVPGSPEAAATLATCNITIPAPCKDNYSGDCGADFPGMCTDPVRACAAARICPQSCGYCKGVTPEMQSFLDQAYNNLQQLSQ